MFIDAELAQRDLVGLLTLMDGPIDHCPQDLLMHIIRCAILGSPHQILRLSEIQKAMRIRFEHFVKIHDAWPVSRFRNIVSSSGFEFGVL